MSNIVKKLFDRQEEHDLKTQAFEERGKSRILTEQSHQAVEELRVALRDAESIIEKRKEFN